MARNIRPKSEQTQIPSLGLEERSKEEGMDGKLMLRSTHVQIHRHTVNTVIKWEFGSTVDIIASKILLKAHAGLRKGLSKETQHAVPHRYVLFIIGVQQNVQRAFSFCSMAADQNYIDAISQLGWFYETGMAVERDYDMARKLYTKAALDGNASAMHRLAMCFIEGKGVRRDYYKAYSLTQMAAIKGWPDAQLLLGHFYTKGCTVPLDLETALYWYHKASEQEVDEAHYILGLCYLHGRGTEQNIEKAEQYFKEAMLYGNPDAKRIIDLSKQKKYMKN